MMKMQSRAQKAAMQVEILGQVRTHLLDSARHFFSSQLGKAGGKLVSGPGPCRWVGSVLHVLCKYYQLCTWYCASRLVAHRAYLRLNTAPTCQPYTVDEPTQPRAHCSHSSSSEGTILPPGQNTTVPRGKYGHDRGLHRPLAGRDSRALHAANDSRGRGCGQRCCEDLCKVRSLLLQSSLNKRSYGLV